MIRDGRYFELGRTMDTAITTDLRLLSARVDTPVNTLTSSASISRPWMALMKSTPQAEVYPLSEISEAPEV